MIVTLADICKKYESYLTDQGTDKGTTHSYVEIYEKLFDSLKDSEIVLTEIGVSGGYSIQTWLEYFSKATIYAIDIDWTTCKFSSWDSRVITVDADATKADIVDKISRSDIIIDDGSHTVSDQIASFNVLFDTLNDKGIYVIEDVNDLPTLLYALDKVTSNYEVYDMRPVKNRFDDILVVIYK